jgi:50S ribosomal subunit-associated GTPase HflX
MKTRYSKAVNELLSQRFLTPEEYIYVLSKSDKVTDEDFYYLESSDKYRNLVFFQYK